jgi:predicted glycosyltransferase
MPDLLAAAAPGWVPTTVLYSHDTFGLGHLRRTLTIARYLNEHWPGSSELVVTGSPLAHGYRLPRGADYVKLPSVVKIGDDRYAARDLPVPLAELSEARAR